jgi:aspartyl protease family protein
LAKERASEEPGIGIETKTARTAVGEALTRRLLLIAAVALQLVGRITIMSLVRFLTVLLMLGLSLGLLYGSNYADAPWSSGDPASLLYGVGLVLAIFVVLAITRLRGIGALAVVVILAITGYAYRFELNGIAEHVLAALMPYRGEQVGKGSVSFEAGPDGQFLIEATVDSTPMIFLVDTGASGVVLTLEDAERLGYDPEDLDFSNSYATANGGVMGAPIVLPEIAIGPIRMDDVAAAVNGAPMPYSLLGVSFLDRLKSYEVKDGILTLTQ